MIGASNMAPGSEDDPRSGVHNDLVECPGCEGEGTFGYSECCTSEIKWTDICTECLEHCDEAECETCEGIGGISRQKYDDIKLQEKQESEANE